MSNQLQQQKYDVIFALAVFEHFTEEALENSSKKIAEMLTDQGLLIVTVPHPFVDKILDLLQIFKLIDGQALEEHHGFDPRSLSEVLSKHLILKDHKQFQFGLNNLYIFTYLKNHYNELNWAPERRGVAYCVRKGEIKSVPISMEGAILIDGLKHAQISQIFKRSKYFISFDRHTAFSRFATLCGCISIVVPEEGIDEHVWEPDLEKRYGISYGFETAKIEQALATVRELKRQLIKEENDSEKAVKIFIKEVENFFG
jgi:hypothetical protein